MAKDVSGHVWTFDAATQGEGFGPNLDSISVNITSKFYVHALKVDTGDGGDVLVESREGTTGDATIHVKYTVVKLDSTPANDTLWVPIEAYVDGLYVTTLPTNGSIQVYLEKPWNS